MVRILTYEFKVTRHHSLYFFSNPLRKYNVLLLSPAVWCPPRCVLLGGTHCTFMATWVCGCLRQLGLPILIDFTGTGMCLYIVVCIAGNPRTGDSPKLKYGALQRKYWDKVFRCNN